MPHALLILLTGVLLLVPLFVYRLRTVLSRSGRQVKPRSRDYALDSTHLLVVLGSGGHTAEMIAMLERASREDVAERKLDWQDYSYLTWIAGSGDTISLQRAQSFEAMVSENDAPELTAGRAMFGTVPRARNIHQPLWTAPFSSLRCLVACLRVLLQNGRSPRGFPDLILCNGPATATILVVASMLLRFLNIGKCETKGKMRTIYVESWARVKKLSLSGRLLSWVVDRFLVQWPQLETRYGSRVEYIGVLV